MSPGASVLAAPTPAAWIEAAREHWRALLIDHANCEKKAASSALALIFAYPEDAALGAALSRLAREELRHFEQVAQMMQRLEVRFERQKPGRYGAGLRAALRSHEPLRKTDLLLSNALIEARSCERFELLAAVLPEPLGNFYAALQRSEARHYQLYLRLASESCGPRSTWKQRLRELAVVEAELIIERDQMLRFHSGPLSAAALPA